MIKVIIFTVLYSINPDYLDYHTPAGYDIEKLNEYRSLPACDLRRFPEFYNVITKDSSMTLQQINSSFDSTKKINDSVYYLYSKKYLFALDNDNCK
jgi:hypothetical protein